MRKKAVAFLEPAKEAPPEGDGPAPGHSNAQAAAETGFEIFTLSPKGWNKPPYG